MNERGNSFAQHMTNFLDCFYRQCIPNIISMHELFKGNFVDSCQNRVFTGSYLVFDIGYSGLKRCLYFQTSFFSAKALRVGVCQRYVAEFARKAFKSFKNTVVNKDAKSHSPSEVDDQCRIRAFGISEVLFY